MKIKNSIPCCLIVLLALPVLGAFAETPAAFSVQLITTFDYPGTGNSTRPQRISDLGDIVGYYIDSSLVHARIYPVQKRELQRPDCRSQRYRRHHGRLGINDSRLVCGDFLDGTSGSYRGFFLMGSRFHNFDVPGSILTFMTGLNNAGDFCGSDFSRAKCKLAFFSVGGIITEFRVPQATASVAEQINSSNQVCGFFDDGSFISHGFYRDSDGAIMLRSIPRDRPGRSSLETMTATGW